MAVMASDLNINRESSFAPSRYIVPSFHEELRRTLDDFKKARLLDQADLLWAALLHNLSHITHAFRLQTDIEFQVTQFPIHYWEFYTLRDVRKHWLEEEKEPWEVEQEAFFAIAREFSQIEKVQSIYVQKYREEVQIQILLSVTQYDNELMDNLLDIEYDIRKRYTEIVFEFFYPPAGISDKKDFVHPQAYCIYSR